MSKRGRRREDDGRGKRGGDGGGRGVLRPGKGSISLGSAAASGKYREYMSRSPTANRKNLQEFVAPDAPPDE